MAVKVSDLISDFIEARNAKYPYVSPGQTQWSRLHLGVDCSGLFVAAFARHGGSIYHGSNTMARKYTRELHELRSGELFVGAVVYKHYGSGGEPDKYKADGMGDFGHVGLVVSTKPLQIIHASSVAGMVTMDTSIRNWQYIGRLVGVDYDEHRGDDDMYQARANCNCNVRQGIGTDKPKVGGLKAGQIVNVYEAEKGWSRINFNDEVAGWVRSDLLTRIADNDPADTPTQPAAPADYVTREEFEALVARVKALEAGIDAAE